MLLGTIHKPSLFMNLFPCTLRAYLFVILGMVGIYLLSVFRAHLWTCKPRTCLFQTYWCSTIFTTSCGSKFQKLTTTFVKKHSNLYKLMLWWLCKKSLSSITKGFSKQLYINLFTIFMVWLIISWFSLLTKKPLKSLFLRQVPHPFDILFSD